MYNNEGGVGDLHRQLEELKRYYQAKLCSVLLIDPMGVLPIERLTEGDPRSLYVDLASEGGIASPDALCSVLLTEGYQGLILDHIEQIPRKGEPRAWEYLVKWLLQRESHCPIYSGLAKGQVMDFSQMAVAVRCSAYPDYLRQADLQAYIIEV